MKIDDQNSAQQKKNQQANNISMALYLNPENNDTYRAKQRNE